MPIRNRHRPGDYLVVCDRTGVVRYRSQMRYEWNGLLVTKEAWEPRHPQDFVHAVPDDQSVPDARPGIPVTVGETTVRLSAPRYATAISVTSVAGISDGDPIGILLDDGTIHWTFVDGDVGDVTIEKVSTSSSYLFNVDGDRIIVADNTSLLNIFDGGGTYTGWLKPSELDRRHNIWIKGSHFHSLRPLPLSSGDTGEYAMEWTFDFDGNDPASSYGWWRTGVEFYRNTWAHFGITYNSDSVENDPIIYINGIPVDITEIQTPTGVRYTDSGRLSICWPVNPNLTYKGYIDDIRHYTRILSPGEMLRVFDGASVSASGLVLHLEMDSETGGITPDSSPFSNDGSVETPVLTTNVTKTVTITENVVPLGSYLTGDAAIGNIVYLPNVNDFPKATYITGDDL